jgi:hypothetical protein
VAASTACLLPPPQQAMSPRLCIHPLIPASRHSHTPLPPRATRLWFHPPITAFKSASARGRTPLLLSHLLQAHPYTPAHSHNPISRRASGLVPTLSFSPVFCKRSLHSRTSPHPRLAPGAVVDAEPDDQLHLQHLLSNAARLAHGHLTSAEHRRNMRRIGMCSFACWAAQTSAQSRAGLLEQNVRALRIY